MALLADALAFSQRGLKIFPLPYGEKRPDNQFIELATDDPTKINQLWADPVTGSREYNIGVLCGSGGNNVLIVDIDTKHDQRFGRSAIHNYLSMGGHFDTLTVKTASGGLQTYFHVPTGRSFRNAQSIVPGVDIRCENGYGIGPGSFAIESGGGYELEHDLPIADLPPVIVPLLKPVEPRKIRLNGHADSEKAIPLFVAYLQQVEPAIEGQGGDTHTYNVACMGVRDYGLSEPTVTMLMLEHFNPRCEPPWDIDELKHKVENADSYAIGEAGSRDPENLLNGVSYKPSALVMSDTGLDLSGYRLLTDIPVTNWLIHPIAIPGEVTVLTGPGGVGKSCWLIGMACHAIMGRDYGPFTIKSPFDIFMHNPEDSRDIISGRVAATTDLYRMDLDQISNHLIISSHSNQALTLVQYDNRKMTTPEATYRFLNELKDKRPDLLMMIFDPLRKMTRGINENDNAMMSEVMGCVNALATSLGVSIWLTHHTAKHFMARKEFDPNSADISVGAGAIASSARIVINMLPQLEADMLVHGKRDEYFSIRIAKNSYGPKPDLTWWERHIHRWSNGQEYPVAIATDPKQAMSMLNRALVHAIGDFILDSGQISITVNVAASVVAENDQLHEGISVRTIAEKIRTLFKRGREQHPYRSTDGSAYSVQLDTEAKTHQITLVPLGYGAPVAPMILAPEGTNE